jgi:hypothetical protein
MNHFVRATLSLALVLPIALAVAATSGTEGTAERTYVGQESCMSAGCHAGPHGDGSIYAGAEPFRETFHQKIHRRPTPETVVLDSYFENDSVVNYYVTQVAIAGKDTLKVEFSKGAGPTDYFIQMRFSEGGDSTARMRVEYTYGGAGWLERYLVKIDDSYYVMPFQYKLPAYAERSDSGGAFFFLDLNKWFSFDASTGEMKFFKPNTNQFRAQSWDRNCSACHVNGFDIATVVRNGGADTAFKALWVGRVEGDSALQDQNISIGCESCHGPGSEHLSNPIASTIISPKRWGTSREATDLKLDLCNQCHIRVKSTGRIYNYPYDDSLKRPYIPGTPLSAYYDDIHADMNHWPDNSAYAHHQSGQDFLVSKPYAAHVFNDGCWSCHTTHTNGKNGLPYQLRENYFSMNDGEGCLTCHGSAGPSRTPALVDMSLTETRGSVAFNLHTQHPASVSQCVNCHFTKTASIGFVDLPRHRLYEFSSHHFRVIRPSLTRAYRNGGFVGMMNTCAESCHRNGRGSRNSAPTEPIATDYGISDPSYGNWKEPTDIALADSLWYHYQRMYSQYVGAVRLPGNDVGTTGLLSTAPNPMSSSTTVRFDLARRAAISLEVFDINGDPVRLLAAGEHAAGSYSQQWDGGDEMGAAVPNGTYIVRLSVDRKVYSRKIVVLR